MGPAPRDHRAMSHRTTSERTAAKRARLAEASAPPDFAVRTLEATAWSEEDRYPRWLLETHSAGSRLAFNRNRPND
jgi:hypothetical protein